MSDLNPEEPQELMRQADHPVDPKSGPAQAYHVPENI